MNRRLLAPVGGVVVLAGATLAALWSPEGREISYDKDGALFVSAITSTAHSPHTRHPL